MKLLGSYGLCNNDNTDIQFPIAKKKEINEKRKRTR